MIAKSNQAIELVKVLGKDSFLREYLNQNWECKQLSFNGLTFLFTKDELCQALNELSL